MGHGYENTSIADIRNILREKYNVDEETLKQTKKPLVDLLLAYGDSLVSVDNTIENVDNTADIEIVISEDYNEIGSFEDHNNKYIPVDDYNIEPEIEEENIEEESVEQGSLDNTNFSFNDLEIEIQDDGINIPEVFEEEVVEKPSTIDNVVYKEVDFEENIKDLPPTIFDEGWSEYVISLLRDREIYNGYPKCIGLRRLVQLLVGPIVNKEIKSIVAPTNDNQTATIIVSITCNVKNRQHPAYSNKVVMESSIADANTDNNKDFPYSTHMSPIAERRAESRCYRNLLNLDIASAEEMAGTQTEGITMSDITSEYISQVQILALDLVAKRNNINVMDFINTGKSGTKYSSINEVPSITAIKMLKILNKMAAGEIEKPDNIGEYDVNWNK